MTILLYLIYLTLIIAPIYFWMSWRQVQESKKKNTPDESWEFTSLRIDVPRNNDKAPLAAEQMFASIHGIYNESVALQYHMGFEIVSRDKFIQFYLRLPKQLKDFVEGQIYAQYPNVEILEVKDYVEEGRGESISFAVCELLMTKPDVYPIKLFSDFEVDPISGITSVMSNLPVGEQVWLQLLIRPIGDEWQEKGNGIISSVRSGKKSGGKSFLGTLFSGINKFLQLVVLQALKPGAEMPVAAATEVKLPGTVEEALKAIEYKIIKLGFETKIRILALASDEVTARVKCQNVAASFKQFNTTNLNGFKIGPVYANDEQKWQEYAERTFGEKGEILNISELASIYHFPHQNVATPNIVWSGSKKGEPPANLPLRANIESKEITVIGETTFRNNYQAFGIKRDDRRRHIYIVGKSGVGKSVLIENMAIDDVNEGRGVIIVDPHGDLADKILSVIPDHRINDVVVFDPSDRAYPIAFNLLEQVDDDFKGMVASGFVGIFKKIFGDSWGPRLEHILRNTVLALLDFPDSTMLDIPKMLTDNRFRDRVVEKVKDPVIKDFWVNEFAQYDAKFRTEAVSPILNKVGQFLSTSTIRNIVGQAHSKINIRDIMDQEKIMVVNLSRGKIGEDNSALLGAMMVTKVQLAAMSRADVGVEKRPDCYLYVDEFQNFATESFATILAEARKYNLNLTIANQYIAQLPEGVRDAVFGNAGTIICFRVGGADADFLVTEFEPVFDANDLVNLDKYNIYIKLLIDGISSQAFSARTLPPVQRMTENSERAVNYSREHYSTLRSVVEEQIAMRSKQEENELRQEAELFKKGGLQALLSKKGTNYGTEISKINDKEFTPLRKNEIPSRESPAPPQSSVPENRLEEPKNETPIDDQKPENWELVQNQNTSDATVGQADADQKRDKPRILRYQNIIGNKVYKEQTARGGVKWYVGEEIDEEKLKLGGIEINETARKMMALAEKVAIHSAGIQSKPQEDRGERPPSDGDYYKKPQNTNRGEEKKEASPVEPLQGSDLPRKDPEVSERRFEPVTVNQTPQSENQMIAGTPIVLSGDTQTNYVTSNVVNSNSQQASDEPKNAQNNFQQSNHYSSASSIATGDLREGEEVKLGE